MIYSEDILNPFRCLDYYPDFMGIEKYSYMLEFDQPVKMIKGSTSVELANNYCNFSFSAKQIDDQRVLLNCNYSIKAAFVEKDSFKMVKEVNREIENLVQTTLEFKIIDVSK